MRRVLEFTVPVRYASVGVARDELVRAVAQVSQIDLDEDRLYALRVCFSEIIANGIEHGFNGQPAGEPRILAVEGDLDSERGRLRVTVTDGGRRTPTMAETAGDLAATGGRGLAVVRGYSDGAGWEPRTNGVGDTVGWSVWFDLQVRIRAPRRSAGGLSGAEEDVDGSLAAGGIRAAAVRGLGRVRLLSAAGERPAA